jgi:hypothetical protein
VQVEHEAGHHRYRDAAFRASHEIFLRSSFWRGESIYQDDNVDRPPLNKGFEVCVREGILESVRDLGLT